MSMFLVSAHQVNLDLYIRNGVIMTVDLKRGE